MGVPAPPGGRELETRGSPCPVLSSRAPVILQEKQTRLAEAPRLQLSSGFTWDVGLDSLTPALPPRGESSDSEEDEKPEQATVLYCLPGFCPFGRATWRSVLARVSSGGVGPSQAGGSIYGACGLPFRPPASTADLPKVRGTDRSLVVLPCITEEEKQEGKGAGEAEGRERAVPP